jgi:hypothetical protein
MAPIPNRALRPLEHLHAADIHQGEVRIGRPVAEAQIAEILAHGGLQRTVHGRVRQPPDEQLVASHALARRIHGRGEVGDGVGRVRPLHPPEGAGVDQAAARGVRKSDRRRSGDHDISRPGRRDGSRWRGPWRRRRRRRRLDAVHPLPNPDRPGAERSQQPVEGRLGRHASAQTRSPAAAQIRGDDHIHPGLGREAIDGLRR